MASDANRAGAPASTPPSGSAERVRLLRNAEKLSAFTVAYNTLEGMLAITAGLLAGSAALLGFGFDSVIEVTSAGVLWWRLCSERLGRSTDSEEKAERRASRIAGVLLLLLACGILGESARQLAFGHHPDVSVVGMLLTILSAVVMPVLARRKLSVAAKLGSRALRADAHESLACAWMSGTTLLGLALNASLSWWWADPAAAVLLVPLIAREGWEAWHGDDNAVEARKEESQR
jgi:divalent metal cation (Fe/Co/Zn/Cd) transporter